MKNLKKLNAKGFAHWIIPALVVVVIGGIGAYLVTQSHAQTLPSDGSICGTGYKLIDSRQVRNSKGTLGPAKFMLYHKSATGKSYLLCGVLVAQGSAYGGAAKQMDVYIACNNNNHFVGDKGKFKYYAGPVYMNAYSCLSSTGGHMTFNGVTYYANIGGV